MPLEVGTSGQDQESGPFRQKEWGGNGGWIGDGGLQCWGWELFPWQEFLERPDNPPVKVNNEGDIISRITAPGEILDILQWMIFSASHPISSKRATSFGR